MRPCAVGSRDERRGFTLVELVVAVALGSTVVGAILVVTVASGNTAQATVSFSHLQQRAARALESVSQELTMAGASTLTPVPLAPLGSSSITYRRADGFDASGATYGNLRRLELVIEPTETDDGQDNDGDGLIDERQIQLVRNVGSPDQWTDVVVRGVAELARGESANGIDDNGNGLIDEPGLAFAMDGSVITVSVTVQATSAGGRVISRLAETSISLRN